MNSDDWMWVPEEFESVFTEKGPFVKPAINSDGEMIGYSYLSQPKVSQELLIEVVSELVSNGAMALNADETHCISELLKILNPEENEETSEEA